MLIEFRFSNFRSFRDEEALSLVAGPFTEKPETPRFVESIKESLLPVAAIYGANASGKTNALRAIYFFVEAVSQSHSDWKPDGPIPVRRFLNSGEDVPSEFEIDFLTAGTRYRYGFRVNSVAVLEEWLYAYPKGKKQTWFHRMPGKPISFSTKLPGENKTIENLTRRNSLFLSAAAQNNHEVLSTPYRWIADLLFVMEDKGSMFRNHTARLCQASSYLDEVSRLISVADLGVTGIRVESEEIPEEQKATFAKLRSALETVGFEGKLNDPPTQDLKIRLLHRMGNEEVAFNPGQESRGTLAYLALLGPVVDALKKGMPLIVDELDSSLHPLLSTHLVRLFNDPASNPMGSQLIFNTHDTNLLSGGLLRRDQIWFSEKANDGSTHLFPLSDFKLRRTDNLESGYLMGRYGAIPFVNSEGFMSRFEGTNAGKP